MRFPPALYRPVLLLAAMLFVAVMPFVVHEKTATTSEQQRSAEFGLMLDGTWQFAWGRHLNPEEALSAYRGDTLDSVEVPSSWSAHVPKDPDNPYLHGTATYLRHLTLPRMSKGSLVLHVERLPEAYAVTWVPIGAPEEAHLVALEGNLTGPAKPAFVDLSHPLSAQGEGLLVFHVRKDLLAWGGMFNAPQITTSDIDNTSRKLQRLFDGFWTGCLFFAVFQNFYLFTLRRSDWAPLMLGSAALIVMLLLAASSNTIEVLFGSGTHVLRTRIELFGVVAVGPILLITIRYLVPPLVNTPLVVAITAFGVAASGFVAFGAPELMTYYLPVYEVFLIFVFLTIGYGLVRAIIAGKRIALMLLFALIFVLSAAVHDNIAAETGSTQFRITAMAVFVFIALCSLFMASIVSRAINRSQILEEEKQILQKLHNDAVDSARRDHLTGLLNRQAFDHEYSLAWRACREKTEPLSVVLFDIDHFKHVNDTHGHPTGDRVLKALAAH